MGGWKVCPSVVGIKIPRPKEADPNAAVMGQACRAAEEPEGGQLWCFATVKEKRREACRMDGRSESPRTEHHTRRWMRQSSKGDWLIFFIFFNLNILTVYPQRPCSPCPQLRMSPTVRIIKVALPFIHTSSVHICTQLGDSAMTRRRAQRATWYCWVLFVLWCFLFLSSSSSFSLSNL